MEQLVKNYLEKVKIGISSGISYEESIELKKKLVIMEEIGLLSGEEVRELDKEMFEHIDEKVEELHLSVRAYNSLERAGIRTKNQLRSKILNGRLLDIRNIGIGTAREILLKAVKDGIVKLDELSNIRMTKRWEKATADLQAELE